MTSIDFPWSIASVHLSRTFSSCRDVDLPDMNQNWRSVKNLFAFMCLIMCSLTNVSMTLHTTDVKLTGLVSSLALLSLFKYCAYLCFFPVVRYCFASRDWLSIIHRGFDIVSASSFRTLVCILSRPGDLSSFSPLRMFEISSSFIFIGVSFRVKHNQGNSSVALRGIK